MPDLKQAIANWRTQMLAAGIKSPVPLEELENHLREEIERQMKSGLNEQNAFEIAVVGIGPARPLKAEFKMVDTENRNRPLVWTAWILFTISFLLPAYADGRGWQCAALSAIAISWPDFWHGNWLDIHLASLTLANLLVIASPFLQTRLSQNARFLKWWRVANVLAFALAWSFLLLLLTTGGRNELKIGCYIWGMSFLFLSLSTLNIHNRKTLAAKYA